MDAGDLVKHSVLRRCWFLSKAVECGDFARAIEMARAAEEFVTGFSADAEAEAPPVVCNDSANAVDPPALLGTSVSASPPAPLPDPSVAPVAERSPAPVPNVSVPEGDRGDKHSRLAMPAERRDELLDRLAQGAPNKELATFFGVSPKQIQGVRMGAAREIAKRRSRHRHSDADDDSEIEATVDDVVRYLRRQDDVVVRQEDGTFLVNGRFRLDTAELVAKANRMLERQHKPVFRTVSPACELPSSHPTATLGVNGHR